MSQRIQIHVLLPQQNVHATQTMTQLVIYIILIEYSCTYNLEDNYDD